MRTFIKSAVKERNLTITKVAKKANIPKAHLFMIISEKRNPSVDLAKKTS